jgi:hypothetical protein
MACKRIKPPRRIVRPQSEAGINYRQAQLALMALEAQPRLHRSQDFLKPTTDNTPRAIDFWASGTDE